MHPTIIGLILLAVIVGFGYYMWQKNRGGQGRKTTRGRTDAPALSAICLSGPLAGREFRFGRSWLSFGRSPDNDVVIDGALVSRHHAIVAAGPNGLTLSDLGSTNGTWLAGRRVLEQPLSEGDAFQIGPCIFAVAAVGRATLPPAPAQPPAQPTYSPVLSHSVSADMARSVEIRSYDRLEMIGEGGAAYVYKLRHRETGQLAALKILKESADPYFKQRFAEEGQVGLRLQHPHIVQVLATGQSDSIHYILMEYLPGQSLREHLGRAIDLSQLAALVAQIGSALDYAHSQGIFHRDIKPENILFAENGVAKLSDFGIARLTGVRRYTSDGMIIGTPEYMSYEQAKGIELDGRSDQYSLGIVLYEMLGGRTPFQAENALAIVEKHMTDNPRHLRQLNQSVPPNVEKVVMKMLKKNRSDRYPTLAAVAKELGGRPITAALAPPPPAASRPARLIHLDSGRIWAINGLAVLGRDLVDNPLISRRHAQIRAGEWGYLIEDLNSRNGTFVEGQRIAAPTVLPPGARIHLGPVPFQFIIDEPPPGRRLT